MSEISKKTQLTLNFEAGMVQSFGTCREFIEYRSHHQGKLQKHIAMDMDYSPSDLSRKLAQNPNDSRRFTLDDFEKYVETTGDTEPVFYLVEKYLAAESDEEIVAEIERLKARLKK